MPALYPPLVPSPDTSGAEAFDPLLPLVPSVGFLGSRIGGFLGFWIVVDLEAGFAETMDFCSLPEDDGSYGPGDEPAAVQPRRGTDHKQDGGKAHHFDKVGGNEHADGPGRVAAS